MVSHAATLIVAADGSVAIIKGPRVNVSEPAITVFSVIYGSKR